VQVQVSAWCASAQANGEDAASLKSCRVVGSGVIVDASGYIITNEHVVRNARRIRVMLTPKPDHSEDGLAPAGKRQELDAVIVGANRAPVGNTAGDDGGGAGLAPGDVIASLNGMPILNVQELRKATREVIGRKPVVMQIERHGRFLYLDPDFEDRRSVSGTDRDAASDSKTVPARDRH
jgi:S1-C subfamily serine protease